MMPTIEKILYATDLSPNATYAFGYAASMAHKYGARITILHVLEQISETINVQLASIMGQDRWQELQARNQQEAETTIRQRLTDFCGEMKETLGDG